VQAVQPRLMKRVASFLLALGPTWRSPPPMEPRLPHGRLYPSPRRFPVESHLLLGCSHKIRNGTSSAFGLSRHSTAASNTILGLCSQGPSRHVLPHAAPGFLARHGVGHTPRVPMQGRMKTDSYQNSPVILPGLVPCNPIRTPAL
jgi:hypothetical protein